jgi:hypothetical protein
MIEVQLPDGAIAEFPDGTAPGVMKSAIQKRFPPKAPAAAAPSAAPADPYFADLPIPGTPSPERKPVEIDGAYNNLTAGVNDAIYRVAGAPVDLANTALRVGAAGVNAVTGSDIQLPVDTVGGHQSIADAAQTAGVNDPADVKSRNLNDRALRAAGEGVGYALAPLGWLRALEQAGAVGAKALPMLESLVGPSNSAPAAVGNAVAGAGAGVGSAVASEVAPDQYKPMASMIGGLGGAGVGALVASAPALAKSGLGYLGEFLAPITAGGRKDAAGRTLVNAAENPKSALESLAARPVDIVPGSKPTTFQQTGDMGLGALERAVATTDPVPFQTRRADQNAARVNAFENLQPTGAPEVVVGAVRSHLDNIETQSNAIIEAAQKAADGSVSAANQTAETAIGGATKAAQDAAGSLGPGVVPEVAGSSMRDSVTAARSAAKEQERALWKAVDPDGTLALGTSNARGAAGSILKEMTPSTQPMGADEAAIFAAANKYGEAAPLGELTALQSWLKGVIRKEVKDQGQTPAWRRMSMLNSAIQKDLEDGIAIKVQSDNAAVAAGTMSAENTTEAAILRDIQEWRSRQAAESGQNLVGLSGNSGASRAAPISPTLRGQVEGQRGLPNAPSNSGLSADDVNFDADALNRLNTARTATRERVQTFDNDTLAPIHRRPDKPDAGVAASIFFPGSKSPEAIAKYRAAVGDAQALPLLRNYAIDRLRKQAIAANGALDPAKAASWLRQHADALRSLPELRQSVQAAIDAAERVTTTQATQKGAVRDAEAVARKSADTVAKTQREKIDEAQAGILGRLIGVSDPQDVTRVIGSIFSRQDGVKEMGRIRQAIGGNEEALQGLRKAVSNFMADRFTSNAEVATSGVGAIKSDGYQTFVRQNEATLRAAGFKDGEIEDMQQIAADLQRANRSIVAVKLPGGSNTAQDLMATGADSAESVIIRIALAAGGSGLLSGLAAGPVLGGAVTVGAALVGALRQYGISNVKELVADALVNPEVAHMLMTRIKPSETKSAFDAIAKRYARTIAALPAQTQGE